jgi:hypothetical protein
MRGSILTNQRYRYATVFVDQFSDYTFVYLHTSITTEETLKAKKAFEIHADSFGVNVKHYHADNGRFQDIKFKEDCMAQAQRITYCGVNAHFQNGRAERKIRDLQDGARTSLLHAMKKWPSAITVNLWPYAIRYMNDVNNYVPRRNEHQSPIELFSSTMSNKRLNQFYHFGCPVYVLDHNLQSGKRSGMKWKDRVRVGIHLVFSPQHAKTVHLALSLTSSCVSPQFHCTFDSNFETIKEYEMPLSLWQEKAHFVSKENRHDESQVTASTSSERGEVGQESGESRTDDANEEITDTTIHTPEELEPPLQQEPPTTTNAVERQDPGVRRPVAGKEGTRFPTIHGGDASRDRCPH